MKALLDTNILIASASALEEDPQLARFTDLSVSSLSWAELVKGLHTTTSLSEFKARAARLQALRATFGEGLAFNDSCVNAYDRILAAVTAAGGTARAHVMDRLLAATALAHDLTLVTRDKDAFVSFDTLVRIEEA